MYPGRFLNFLKVVQRVLHPKTMFNDFWNKRRKANPDENKYISLCHILEGSGEDKQEIEKIFLTYMTLEDYDEVEMEEMVDYLLEISKDRQ